ncbi:Gfo/Idh/MocA family protein [Sediminivirga luteola]|uniref:Gfo/Idh/MocA family protein n=1 Tax=Sediminivirga luteola TaxID=1774748 RepID=UPI001F563A00|nr:Gfo/Idh/MocA family oxidoreductase [Sediminivirga luteola]MCI2266594.1 Gfo/Idh/MocA family oxidoreductase [Sediminivirga luteola]
MTFPRVLPAPRTPGPGQVPALRWGILGTGWIAERFTDTVRRNTTQQIVAVGSRSAERARRFSSRHGIPRAHGSDESLVQDPGVDVIYVATPHGSHRDHALLALDAGKHVLVEKPLGVNAAQAAEIAGAARRAGLFAAEALWSAFLPKTDVLRQLLDDGALGAIHTLTADIGEYFDSGHRIFDPGLPGGDILDLGTYPAWFATWIQGLPDEVKARGRAGPGGVNAQTMATLSWAGGALGQVHSSLESFTPTRAYLAGEAASVQLEEPFYGPGGFVLRSADGRRSLRWEEPDVRHEGLFHEAVEAARCIGASLPETPYRRLDDSVVTLRLLDLIRAQTGDTSGVEKRAGDGCAESKEQGR